MTFLEVVESIGLLVGAGLAGYTFGYCEKKLNEMRYMDEQRVF